MNEHGRVFDELLVTLVRSGDRRAGERLAARWTPRLLRTARRLLRDDEQARESVQECWVRVVRGISSLREPARFPAWVFGILHRVCADRITTAQRERARYADPESAPEGQTPARAEARLALDDAFGRLSVDHRIAAILFFGEGLTLGEIAEAVGVPLGTAKSRIFTARQQLKADLEGDV